MGGGNKLQETLLAEEGGDPNDLLKKQFHSTPTAEIISDIAIKETLGAPPPPPRPSSL